MLLNVTLVKETRINRGWTQAQLAELCDVNIRTIQRVENDGTASLETTMALAAAFDLEIKELFADPGTEKKNSNKTLYIVLSLIAGFVLGLLF
jgi:transcriptional regulator with XRE-family HTH domain